MEKKAGIWSENGFYEQIETFLLLCIIHFPHTTILQQTTLNMFCQKKESLYNWMDNLWLKVENIVSKGEIAWFEQFLLLSQCFQKAVHMKERAMYKKSAFYKNLAGNFQNSVIKSTIPSYRIDTQLNPFPQTTFLQQGTLKALWQKPEKCQ